MSTRTSLNGLLTRTLNRLSLRLKIVASLAVVGLLLTLLASQLLGILYEGRTDDRVQSRADELSTLLIPALSEENQLQAAATSMTVLADVRSISIADLDTGEVIASASSEQALLAGGLRSASFEAAEAIVSGASGVESLDPSTELQPVLVGDPFNPDNVERFLIVVELDRAAVGADLQFGKDRALLALVSGLVGLLIVTYVLIRFWVSRPLARLAGFDLTGIQSPNVRSNDGLPVDEIARLEATIRRLATAMNEGAVHGGASLFLGDELPDLWLRLDRDLNILESEVGGPDEGAGQSLDLNIDRLSDLLSEGVVDHVSETVGILEPGQNDEFEFVIGARVYHARLEAMDDDFVLELSEGANTLQASPIPTVAVAEILADLLERLPVGVLDANAQGTIQYANRALYGAENAQELIGRPLGDVLPPDCAEAGRQALREARRSGEAQTFEVPPDPLANIPGSLNHVVVTEADDEISYFILSVEVETVAAPVVSTASNGSSEANRKLEEELWSLEVKLSGYEEQISDLTSRLEEAKTDAAGELVATDELISGISSPMATVLKSANSIDIGDLRKQHRQSIDQFRTAIMGLADILDSTLGTNYVDMYRKTDEARDGRFHLATLLDEVAIEASLGDRTAGSRISVMVQPSLPKWLYGKELECRAAIHQMIELARLVATDRPLILAALQDASGGKSIQVRFEIQIPPPKLGEEDLNLLRGCIRGEATEDDIPSSLREILDEHQDESFDTLDIEVVTVSDDATVLRCSASFELAEEFDAGHDWVRGLRTLIIQGANNRDNGLQSALAAFGIIGYVVSSEKDLIEALEVAEDYSNPYRLVIADVDTPDLESFVGQLFDGDAPVVLVGQESKSAMVGAITAGYNGYIAKPVRQVDLLEVILSTVQPPEQFAESDARTTAA